MKIDEIKTLANRRPFRSFALETQGGNQILVTEPSDILFPKRKPELVIAFTTDGLMHLVEVEFITAASSE